MVLNKISGSFAKLIALLFNPLFIIIVGIGLIFYFGVFSTGAIFPGTIHSTSSSLISQDSISATYRLTGSFSGQGGGHPCDGSSQATFSFGLRDEKGGELPDFVEGLKEEAGIITQDVQFTGITARSGACSDNSIERNVIINQSSSFAECEIEAGPPKGNGKREASVFCEFQGEAYAVDDNGNKVNSGFLGLKSATATVTFPKEGVSTTNLSGPLINNSDNTSPPSDSPTSPLTGGGSQTPSSDDDSDNTSSKSLLDKISDFFSSIVNFIKGAFS